MWNPAWCKRLPVVVGIFGIVRAGESRARENGEQEDGNVVCAVVARHDTKRAIVILKVELLARLETDGPFVKGSIKTLVDFDEEAGGSKVCARDLNVGVGV